MRLMIGYVPYTFHLRTSSSGGRTATRRRRSAAAAVSRCRCTSLHYRREHRRGQRHHTAPHTTAHRFTRNRIRTAPYFTAFTHSESGESVEFSPACQSRTRAREKLVRWPGCCRSCLFYFFCCCYFFSPSSSSSSSSHFCLRRWRRSSPREGATARNHPISADDAVTAGYAVDGRRSNATTT